jgi:hypothetical protein
MPHRSPRHREHNQRIDRDTDRTRDLEVGIAIGNDTARSLLTPRRRAKTKERRWEMGDGGG